MTKKLTNIALAGSLLFTGCGDTCCKATNDTGEKVGDILNPDNPDNNNTNKIPELTTPGFIEKNINTGNIDKSFKENTPIEIDLKNYIDLPKGMEINNLDLNPLCENCYIDENGILHIDPINTDEENKILNFEIQIEGKTSNNKLQTHYTGEIPVQITIVDEQNDNPIEVKYDKCSKKEIYIGDKETYVFTVSDEDGINHDNMPDFVIRNKNWEKVGKLDFKIIETNSNEIKYEVYVDTNNLEEGTYSIGADNFETKVGGEKENSTKACYLEGIQIIEKKILLQL